MTQPDVRSELTACVKSSKAEPLAISDFDFRFNFDFDFDSISIPDPDRISRRFQFSSCGFYKFGCFCMIPGQNFLCGITGSLTCPLVQNKNRHWCGIVGII